MALMTLTQTGYTTTYSTADSVFNVRTYRHTFALSGAAAFRRDVAPYRRPYEHGDEVAEGSQSISYGALNPVTVRTFTVGRRWLSVQRWVNNPPVALVKGEREDLVIDVTGYSDLVGDDFNLPVAFPIAFSPAVPAWAMDPAPTHLVIDPFLAGTGAAFVLCCLDNDTLRAGTLMHGSYIQRATPLPLVSGLVSSMPGGPLETRFTQSLHPGFIRILRQSDSTVFRIGVGLGSGPQQPRFRGYGTSHLAGAYASSSPLAATVTQNIRFDTGTAAIGNAPIIFQFFAEAKYWGYVDSVIDIEAAAPAASRYCDSSQTYNLIGGKPGFSASACRDVVGVWAPGALMAES